MVLPASPRRADTLQPGDVLVVVHDFDARSPDELTLRKAERLQLLELDDGFGDGWYLGRHMSRDATGLFPGAKPAKPAKPTMAASLCVPVYAVVLIPPRRHAVYTTKLPPHLAATPPPSATRPAVYTPAQPTNSRLPTLSEKSSRATDSDAAIAAGPSFSPALAGADAPRSSAIASVYGWARNAISPAAAAQGHGPAAQRSIGHALHSRRSGEESPVMNETLSVIDEHITNLRTPRPSLAPPHAIPEDSESDYSSHLDRGSIIIGPESEADEQAALTKEDVAAWDHRQVARHLRAIGVDAKHCDIFEDQEISGEVLLDMDQSFIHMKDFDFGVMGRRLKTWHKIRDFQTQVRGRSAARQPSTSMPRIHGLRESGALSVRQPHGHPSVPTSAAAAAPSNDYGRGSMQTAWRTSVSPESPQRPSAGAVRDLNHSHHHSRSQSSLDLGGPLDPSLSSMTSLPSAPTTDKNQTSFDHDRAAGPSTPTTHGLLGHESSEMSPISGFIGSPVHVDLDRGYFSGNEVDKRKGRNTLKKRDSASVGGAGSPVHSHQSSLLDGGPGLGTHRHLRLSFVDSVPDREGPVAAPVAKASHGAVYKGRFRSASARGPVPQPSFTNHSPAVTNLESEAGPASTSATVLSSFSRRTMSAKALKLIGLRSTSEVVTSSEKETAASPTGFSGSIDGSPAGTAAGDDGSHTPSATSQTFELDNTDSSSKGTEPQLAPILSTRIARQKGPKTKQQTSAYQRGLLKMTPAEARTHCDHSGWMKKKSPSLVTTWKPRLFILRGRRLSYYYDENDSEERGIIDISGHKVLAANNDPVLSLHAALTGAKATSSSSSTVATDASSSATDLTGSTGSWQRPRLSADGHFYFKLIPPKAGQSRAVQFTKPTVHYFQCDTMAEGRKWMGEIMKATILHDLSSFETTNKQRTITLAKARERRERPPALKEDEEKAA
ncbi:hypothetical protein DV736_g6505, partial [Chaetothyriales sp. CBS 134916]